MGLLSLRFSKLPIRIKITVWYAVSFMLVLAFSFLSFYYVVQNLVLSNIDDTLKSQVKELVNLIEERSISPASKEFIFDTFSVTKNSLVLILDNKGNIVSQSQRFPFDPQTLQQLVNESSQNSQSDFKTIDNIRYYIFKLQKNDQFLATIIVGDSVDALQKSLSVLFNTLIIIFFIFALPLILLSFLESDMALAPLRDIVRTMESITTKNLSARVDIINPKDEIGEVSLAINQLLDRLQKGFMQERELIHNVSHQLKTPLTAIRSDIEIAITKKRSVEQYEEILLNLLSDTQRMSSTLTDMVNFAWATAEDQQKNFKEISLTEMVNETMEITYQLSIEKNIEVTADIQIDMKINGQKEKLQQALINIVENAVKYTPQNGKIYIKAYLDGNKAKVLVKDTGVGIFKKDLDKIFERFYRGEDNHAEGTGLGLSIASAIFKAHKGSIEVTSERQKGSTFLITLPAIVTPQPKANGTTFGNKLKSGFFIRSHIEEYFNDRWKKNNEEKKEEKKA